MLKGFEDAFVDAQANVISLCLELLKNSEKSADVIYVYILQNDDEEYIDAFFEKDGKLFTTNDWCSDAQIKEFFHCGIEDIESIVELCDTYDAKCPHEFKLVYNVNSKSFDSNYNYENATDVYDKDVIELVEEWFNECEKNISHQALYPPYKTCARPYDMFISEVDHVKYPDIKQKYRFEVIETDLFPQA